MDLSYSVVSVNGVPIRLLAERWSYLNACCDDVLATVERPDFILRGGLSTQVAVRRMAGARYLAVTYRELSSREGFVISASVASNIEEQTAVWLARGRR
jgi:hypothetical protein